MARMWPLRLWHAFAMVVPIIREQQNREARAPYASRAKEFVARESVCTACDCNVLGGGL